MSYADQVFIQNCQDILSRGVWDTDREVRPRWEDGTPAHTIKLFGVVNRYDLRREFPILTVRRQFLKSAVDELLWIWQKKSNNVHDLSEMALYPCAYSMTFNVSGNTLNGILNQRSQDMLTANGWNVMQYAVLLHMVAQVSGLEAGELVHVTATWTRCGRSSLASPMTPPDSPWTPLSPISTPSPRTACAWRGIRPTLCRERSRWRSKRRRTVWISL